MDHVVERSLQLEVMLDEQHRLMRMANKKIVELEQRVLDEQAAFDKMETLFLQGQEGYRVLEFKLADLKRSAEPHSLVHVKSKLNDEIDSLKAQLNEATEVVRILEHQKASYKRLYEKNRKFLNTTLKRLESSSWENEVELRHSLNRYGAHKPGCLWVTKHGCNCGWEKEKIALALLDQLSRQ